MENEILNKTGVIFDGLTGKLILMAVKYRLRRRQESEKCTDPKYFHCTHILFLQAPGQNLTYTILHAEGGERYRIVKEILTAGKKYTAYYLREDNKNEKLENEN